MTFLYILLGLILTVLLYMRFEAGFLKVDRVLLTDRQPSLKIIQLSDIHIGRLKVRTQAIREVLEQEQPDFVVMTGDYIENAVHIPGFLSFLESIGQDLTIFLCLGNHDHKALYRKPKLQDDLLRRIEKLGITVLQNSSVCYQKGERKYNIVGIDDLNQGTPDLNKAFSACCGDAAVTLAISHNPDIALKIPPGRVDYLFTGHFHGGQIWMPFGLEYRLLRREKLSRMGIRKGLHSWNGAYLYISRGLGNVCFPLRFLSRPEITVFEL
jgi:uncharacterized protein